MSAFLCVHLLFKMQYYTENASFRLSVYNVFDTWPTEFDIDW